MTSYLRAGWFERSPGKERGLRTEVIDGAMDVAGILVRAGISGTTVLRLALRTRALMAIADPRMLGVPKFTERERELVMNGLTRHTDKAPELHAFVADCVERVDNLIDLMAFYLHLTHVARMIELLSVAVRTTPRIVTPAATGDASAKAAASKQRAKKASKVAKPAAKKAAARSKPARAKKAAAKTSMSAKKAVSKKAAKKAVSKKKLSKASGGKKATHSRVSRQR